MFKTGFRIVKKLLNLILINIKIRNKWIIKNEKRKWIDYELIRL